MYQHYARILPCVIGWLRRPPLLDFLSHGWLSTFEVGCGVLPDVESDMLPPFFCETIVQPQYSLCCPVVSLDHCADSVQLMFPFGTNTPFLGLVGAGYCLFLVNARDTPFRFFVSRCLLSEVKPNCWGPIVGRSFHL